MNLIGIVYTLFIALNISQSTEMKAFTLSSRRKLNWMYFYSIANLASKI